MLWMIIVPVVIITALMLWCVLYVGSGDPLPPEVEDDNE